MPGPRVNGENDLGLPNRLHQGRVEFMFRLRERGKVRVDYFEADRSGNRALAKDVVFGNQTFTAGQQMLTSLDWRQFDITYSYSLFRNDRFEVATGLGIYFLQVDAIGEVPAQNQRQEHTSELQSQSNLVCRLLLEKKKTHARILNHLPPALDE